MSDPRELLDAYEKEDPADGDCGKTTRGEMAPKVFQALRSVLLIHDVSRHGSGNCCNCFDALGNHFRWPCPTAKRIIRALEES